MKDQNLRKITALLAIATLSVGLTACSGLKPEDAVFEGVKQTCDTFTGGKNVEQIQVTETDGAAPTMDFPTPLKGGTSIETRVLKEGTGAKFTGSEQVTVEFSASNGTTGEAFGGTSFDGTAPAQALFTPGQTPDLCHALSGVRIGSRVVVLVPAKLAHGGQGIPNAGVGADDSVIYLIDLVDVALPYATGSEQPAAAGFPAVVRAPDGTPGITNPTGDAPTETKVATLLKGVGNEVKLGDSITVHYSGFIWGGEKFESTWDTKQPANFTLTEGNLIKGFITGLVGQTVGSQVIVVITPEDGYGAAGSSSIPANSTLIFVIDILDSATPSQ